MGGIFREAVALGARTACLVLVCLAGGITSVSASLTYSNPFHPDQCETAVAVAERVLAHTPQDARAREILAEGLLCRGLVQDDPWALAAAIDAFRAQVSAHPDDFFPRLYVAAAMQRRFPLAEETLAAHRSVQTALTTADVGAGRERLRTHLEEAIRALEAQRRQFLPLLQERLAALERGPLAAPQLIDLLILLPQTGPSGVERARKVLDAALAQQPDAALDTFYRAEILRGQESPEILIPLYRAAVATLCDRPDAPAHNECQRARWRLGQLHAARGPASDDELRSPKDPWKSEGMRTGGAEPIGARSAHGGEVSTKRRMIP